MRYTSKSKFGYGYRNDEDMSDFASAQLALIKLGKLEDIEEELGADLVTVYKALKSPTLFLRAGKKIIDLSHSMKSLEISADGDWFIAATPRFEKQAVVLPLSLCGKTWSTKKEELK